MDRPRALQIRPITNCPAKCATCTTLIDRAADDMSLAQIEDNLRYFTAEHGIDELVFSGAEITTRDDFLAILDVVRASNLRLVTLISSGLVWTDELARACSGIIHRVVVALTPTHAADWRNPLGRTAIVRRNMRVLKSAGLRVQSNTVLTTGATSVLDEIAAEIEVCDMAEPIFLFPFATGGATAVRNSQVPEWSTIESKVERVLTRLAARQPRLKNLPPCATGKSLHPFMSKTTTRFLVERSRQRAQHAIIPPFVGMSYAECCSTCNSRAQCDGYWPAHVEAGTLPEPSS